MSADPLTNNFNLHLLFDAYIASNLGNTSSIALGYFNNSITTFLIENKEEHFVKSTNELLKKSLTVNQNMEQLLTELTIIYDFTTFWEVEKQYDELFTKFSGSSIARALNISIFALEIKPHITPSDVIDKVLVETYIRSILKYVVENNLLVNKSLIIPSGYINRTTRSGHAIGLYYNKLENYTLAIANSGAGIHYHKSDGSRYEVIIEKNEIPLETLSNILVENYLATGVIDKTYTVEKYYERVLIPYISPLRSDVPEKRYFHEPQISGSCTFFGFFYIFYYYFLKRDKTPYSTNGTYMRKPKQPRTF
ncbi:MAG: hypothetical protein Hyperionvirus22_8 [Hyperionvirus sp.]|uniref:Uncharacterized protein n=1 Tax=Hyperionvirus sp. TaxID=2487770 RepID=A0A3G5AAS1_9VIRU|nr:MAG: hypothetical protein Hyperionvirus22_8 [Hyperionvirus sp.]